MIIYTLAGPNNSGKTTTITRIFEELKKYDANITYFKRLGADERDFIAALVYNERKIVFCSIGDMADLNHSPLEYIMKGIFFAFAHNAHYFINAFSTNVFPEICKSSFIKNNLGEIIPPKEIYQTFFTEHDMCIMIPMEWKSTKEDADAQINFATKKILNPILF